MSGAEAGLAFALAMVISVLTVPAGVSGAVFLLPAQLSLLGTPSPAVTPTNLLYNVVATPGALLRFRSRGQLDRTLVAPMMVGAFPGVAVGAVLRTTIVSGAGVFRVLVGLLLVALGARLVHRVSHERSTHRLDRPRALLVLLGLLTGIIGGLYGIGGGSLLAPILATMGFALAEVAPAALMTTLGTSVVGVLAFAGLVAFGYENAAPDWGTGLTLGLGGLVGGYLGARLQPHLREATIRRLLGVLALVIGASYIVLAIN